MFDFLNTRPKRTRIPVDESDDPDSETLLPSSSTSLASFALKNLHAESSRHDARIAIKSFLACTIVYVTAAIWVGWSVKTIRFVSDVDEFCLDHVSMYSPVVKNVRPNWHTQQFNGTFLHENAYRQPAGEEVDAAWAALGVNYRSIVVPLAEAEKTGLRHDQVKISETYGGGFPANVEGLHHLHCLNLLRMALHWNYDYYVAEKEGPFSNSEYIIRVHTTHCLDTLRQVLMCNPDVGVLGQVWWQAKDGENPQPFVDFNTRHRCRDFEAVRMWAQAHQLPPEKDVDMNRFYEMPKPGDVVYDAIP